MRSNPIKMFEEVESVKMKTIENYIEEFDKEFCVKDDILGKEKYGSATFYPASRIKSFLRSSLTQIVEETKRDFSKQIRDAMLFNFNEQMRIYEGKLPFVVFGGKADEIEKNTIYSQAVADHCALVNSLTPKP